MITQFQHLYFNDNMVGTTLEGGYQTMNFESLAASCGIKYVALSEIGLEGDKWLNLNEPVMIDYQIDGLTSVSPKLEYNGLYSMPTPQLDQDEYESAMN
jgi:acetolactate synthase-1/2/3 large subunit